MAFDSWADFLAMGKHRDKPFEARPGPHMPPAMHGIGMDGHKAACALAASPIRRVVSGIEMASNMASAIAPGSGGTTQPVTPDSTSSSGPPLSVAVSVSTSTSTHIGDVAGRAARFLHHRHSPTTPPCHPYLCQQFLDGYYSRSLSARTETWRANLFSAQ